MRKRMKGNIFVAVTIMVLLVLSGCKSRKEVSLTPGERGSAKEIYEKAKRYIKRDAERARVLFKEVMQLYPESVYARLGKIGIADSYFREKGSASLIMAAAEYQEYVNLYPNSPDAPYAKFQVGMCYLRQMKSPGRDQTNTINALKYFENMVKQFPDTKEAEEAKKHIAKARQYLASHYFSIGVANYRLKAYKGAIARFKQVIDNYPEFDKNDKLFYYTGKTYFAMRDYDSALSFFQRVINSYPRSRYVKKSQKMIKKINRLQSLSKSDKK